MFSTPRTRAHATAFLSVDHDGSPLLALAHEKKFSLYRLTAQPRRHIVRHLDERRGKLVRAPIVDPYGYSFVLGDEDGALRLDRVDRPSQPPRPSTRAPAAGHASWKASWNDSLRHHRCSDGEDERELEALF